MIDNPFGDDDPIVLLPAIKPDVALIHAPDGRPRRQCLDRPPARARHHGACRANATVVTVERLHDGDLLDDPVLAAGTLPGFYVETIAVAPTAAGRCRCRIIIRPTSAIWPTTPALPVRPRASPIISTTHVHAATPPDVFRDEELLIDVIARLIGDVRHVAVGNASPIPATAALLARERGRAGPYVSLLQSRKHNFFTDGGRELFDCAGQGRIDVFFLSGGEIDGEGNINLVSIGDHDAPKVRFPGSFGAGYLYYVVPKVILFRTEHSRRTLVREGRISSAARAPVRPMCTVPAARSRWSPIAACLCSINSGDASASTACIPAIRLAEVIENTGFSFDRAEAVPKHRAPSPRRCDMLRTVVAPQLAEVYPQFTTAVFDGALLAFVPDRRRSRIRDIAARTILRKRPF